MKSILLSAIFLMCIISMFAQTTITSNDLPKAGRIYTVAFHTGPNVNLGNASSSPQTWDFSALQPQYLRYASYSPTTQNHYWSSVFTESTMYTYGPAYLFAGFYGSAPVDQSLWGYMYWKTDNTGLYSVGWRGDYGIGNRNVLETQKELLMGTPASFGTVFNNNSSWTIKIDAIPSNYDTNYVVKSKKILTADAFGTLTTPYGTFNVLRVHEYATEIDSSFASQYGNPLPYPGVVISKDTVNNYYFWANNVGYPVAIARCNAANVLQHIEYLYKIDTSYSIQGQVMQHNNLNPVGYGYVSSIAHDSWDHLFGIDEQIPLDSAGHFQFANVLPSNRMIQTSPDTAAYPSDMPSYFGNEILWNNASILHVTRDTNIVITCVGNDSTAYYNSGIGEITGIVYVDTSASKNNLIPSEDITIILLNGNSMSTAKHGKTNHQGNYHFKSLPNSSYKVAVEIAGVLQDSTYLIQLNNNSATNISFYYDSLHVYLYNPSNIQTVKNFTNSDVTVYPNPFTDKTYLKFTNKEEKEMSYSLSVFDVTGKKLQSKMGKAVNQIELFRENLKAGIYFFSLELNGEIKAKGKLIIK